MPLIALPMICSGLVRDFKRGSGWIGRTSEVGKSSALMPLPLIALPMICSGSVRGFKGGGKWDQTHICVDAGEECEGGEDDGGGGGGEMHVGML